MSLIYFIVRLVNVSHRVSDVCVCVCQKHQNCPHDIFVTFTVVELTLTSYCIQNQYASRIGVWIGLLSHKWGEVQDL